MCDYPITPLPPYTNKMYEQFARDFGRTAQEQMEADTVVRNGVRVVDYLGYLGWVERMVCRFTIHCVNLSVEDGIRPCVKGIFPCVDSGELLKFTKNYLDFYIGGMGY